MGPGRNHEIHDIQWLLKVVPSSALLARNQSWLPEAALIVGLIGAIVFSLTLYVAQNNWRYAKWEQAANRLLQDEVKFRRLAVAESRLNEQRFRDFGEVASDWFWETDAQGRFTQISGTLFEEVGGISTESVLGLTHAELLSRIPQMDDQFDDLLC